MQVTNLRMPKARLCVCLLLLFALDCDQVKAQTKTRSLSGRIVTSRNESVKGISITARYPSGEQKTVSDEDGAFSLKVPDAQITLIIEGKHVVLDNFLAIILRS